MVANRKAQMLGGIIVVALLGLFVVSVVLDFGFEGTDDRASGAIQELHPGYQPWFGNLFEPGERAEKFLFAFQIVLGVALGFFCLKLLQKRNNAR